MVDRVILVPVDPSSVEANLHVANWYAANLKQPRDRLVFVSVLVPGAGGGGTADQLQPATTIESAMERQLADSCRREERLAARLKASGCCASFRYIHTFGRSREEALVRIAGEQRAGALLATYEAISAAAAADCWDFGGAFRLFRRAGLALLMVPPGASGTLSLTSPTLPPPPAEFR